MPRRTQEQWIEHYHEMSEAENRLREQGYTLICGVDEVGRGPLAGPVMAGAVILPPDTELVIPGVDDSKKVSAKKRAELYDVIREKAIAWAVGAADVETIDRINILQATMLAMRRAIAQLTLQPDALLIDALTLHDISIPQQPIVHGDARSVSIAAASILAKVTRDTLMEELDELYPQYGFRDNKGYGTAAHIAAIREYGPCPIHRRTFIGHFVESD
ncbi:MAG: ribonuclease HII [Firmicutes bacterium]|nr:ribonuclease HII [Bacillota bacterium]